jgi:hypothetical protein
MHGFVVDRLFVKADLDPRHYDPRVKWLRDLPRNLGDVVTVLERPPSRLETERPQIDPSCIDSTLGAVRKVKPTTDSEAKSLGAMVEAGDVILSLVRPWRGTVAVISNELEGMVVTGRLVVLRPSDVLPAVIWAWLRMPDIASYLRNLGGPIVPVMGLLTTPFPGSFSDQVLRLAAELNDRLLRTKLAPVPGPVSPFRDVLPEDWYATPATWRILRKRLSVDRLDPKAYLSADAPRTLAKVGYPVRPLGELVEAVAAGTPGSRGSEGEAIPMLGPAQIVDGQLTTKGLRALVPTRRPIRVSTGDLVIIVTGQRAGEVAVVDNAFDGMCINNNVARLRPTQDLLPQYLSTYLTTVGRPLLRRTVSGVVIPHLSLNTIRALPVIIPPLEDQRRLSAYTDEPARTDDLASVSEMEAQLQAQLMDQNR